ncbi:MAG: DUF4062 domain-containing protein [bacterium]
MQPIKIFISSVQREFAEERQLLCNYIRQDALLGRFFAPFLFEELPAVDLTAQEAYLSEVERTDIYIGIFGNSYGYEDNEGVSPTEREFDRATEKSKYRIAFISKVDVEQRESKEKQFIAKVEGDLVRKSFINFEELRSGVYASLVHYLEMKEYLRLLPFDTTASSATIDDIDEIKVRRFIRRARMKRNFPMTEDADIQQVLTHLALIKDDGRILNAAILLFAKEPQRFFITSEVKCAQFYGKEIQKPIPSYQVYRGDVFELIEQAVGFVMSRIDARVGTRAKQIQVDIDYEIPLLAVTEAIVNAIAHRDYTSNGSVQVMLFKDRLEVWNPGILPIGLTVEKLAKSHQSIPANPLLANPMYLAGSIERLGTGTRDIISMCENAGLRTPEFVQDDIFRVVLWRKDNDLVENSDQVTAQVSSQVGSLVNNDLIDNQDGTSIDSSPVSSQVSSQVSSPVTAQVSDKILKLIEIFDGDMNRIDLQNKLNIIYKSYFREEYLSPAIEDGYIELTIPDKPTSSKQKYRLTNKGKSLLFDLSNKNKK